MKIDLLTIRVSPSGYGSNRCSIGAITDEGRMHYWASFPDLIPESSVLYVNDRPGQTRPHHTTRRDLRSDKGKLFRQTCERVIREHDLVAKAIEKLNRGEEDRLAAAAAERAVTLKHEAGPLLYEASTAFLAAFETALAVSRLIRSGFDADDLLGVAEAKLREAIRLAEGVPVHDDAELADRERERQD